jgi:membrane-bound serine protease (ClpP class)
VAGGLSLLLALFAFQIVPVDTAGLLLVVFGLGLLLLELKVPSFGVLGIGGTVALLIGSVMITRQVPEVRVGIGPVVAASVTLAAAFLLLGRLALQAQRRAPVTGAQAMIGETGRTRAALAPGVPGQIDVRGEIWRGVSRVPIPAGAAVSIVELQGLTAVVEPVGAATSESEDGWKR